MARRGGDHGRERGWRERDRRRAGSNADLDAADVEQGGALLRQAKVVVAQLEVPVPAIQRAFEIAREAGVITVLNAAPAQDLPAALLGLSDWLIVNETEALQLARAVALPGDADGIAIARATAAHLRTLGPRHVLVTLGGAGAWLLSDEHPEGCICAPPASMRWTRSVPATRWWAVSRSVWPRAWCRPARPRAGAVGRGARGQPHRRAAGDAAPLELPELPELATLTANGAPPPTATPDPGAQYPMDSKIPASGRIPVLFDTDPGIDDALALALLACHPRFELVAVTTAFGNGPVATTTRNARGLTALYRKDVPVAAGAEGRCATNAGARMPRTCTAMTDWAASPTVCRRRRGRSIRGPRIS